MSIDPDLYQTATLGLLALGVILQLAILAALSGIKKALGPSGLGSGASAGGQEAASPATQATYYPPAGSGATPQSGTESGGAGAGGFATGAGAGGAGAATATGGAVPAAATAAPATGAAQTTAAAAPAASAAEPQEQPFERDGRWWFRRGTELLVYDEQSAQWVPAPAEATVAAAAPAGMAPAGGTAGAGGGEAGSFWKCPSCGAVNGSTSSSCRMCFTARSA